MPLVRRITGGGAIWHEHEVTYCLTGVLGENGFPERTKDCYPLLHRSVQQLLNAGQTPHEMQAETVGDRRYQQDGRCFASPAADDLMRQQAKVLGSAARTRGNRILIHGSLKLASNPWDGETTAGCGLEANQAEELLKAAFSQALNLALQPDDFTDAERQAQRELLDQRYGSPLWLEERKGPAPDRKLPGACYD